jgi:hydroxyacylglutathione hydrolase
MPEELISGRIHHFLGRGYDSNAYVIDGGSECVVVDSGLGKLSWGGRSSFEELEETLRAFSVSRIILTHAHIDHSGGAAMLVEKGVDVSLAAHFKEAEVLEGWNTPNIDPFMGTKMKPLKIARHLEDGDRFLVGDLSFEVIHTPGHSAGSICLWCPDPDKRWLFSGDTVFTHGSFGRTDLPTGSSSALVDSIDRLLRLPVRALLPGHERPVLDNGQEHIAMARNIAGQMWGVL